MTLRCLGWSWFKWIWFCPKLGVFLKTSPEWCPEWTSRVCWCFFLKEALQLEMAGWFWDTWNDERPRTLKRLALKSQYVFFEYARMGGGLDRRDHPTYPTYPLLACHFSQLSSYLPRPNAIRWSNPKAFGSSIQYRGNELPHTFRRIFETWRNWWNKKMWTCGKHVLSKMLKYQRPQSHGISSLLPLVNMSIRWTVSGKLALVYIHIRLARPEDTYCTCSEW